MRSLILLFLSLPIFLVFEINPHSKHHLSSVKRYFPPNYSYLEDQCSSIITILDGAYSPSNNTAYKAKREELEEAYLAAIKTTPSDASLIETSMKSFLIDIEGDDGKEEAFYARVENQVDNFQAMLTTFKAQAQGIFAILSDLDDNTEAEFNVARWNFQNKVLSEKPNLASEQKNSLDTFLDEINKSFDESLSQYRSLKAELNQQEDTSTESDKLAESNTAASENLKQKTESEELSEKMEAEEALSKAIETAIASSLPPEFCWRGNRPQCPVKYPGRSGLLCYRDCETVKSEYINKLYQENKLSKAESYTRVSYKLWGGVCWENCNAYKSPDKEPYASYAGFLCMSQKHWYHSHIRDSFVTSSVTNYNSDVVCPDGKPKSWFLGLCYRNCQDFGYVDCGAGACALDNKSCAKELTNIVAGTVIGLAEVVFFGLSMGTSSVIKEAVTAIEKIAKKVVNGVEMLIELVPKIYDRYDVTEKVFANPILKANVLRDCKTKARTLLENFPQKIAEIDARCTAKVEEMEPEAKTKKGLIAELAYEVAKDEFKDASADYINSVIAKYADNVPDVKILLVLYNSYMDCNHLIRAGSTASENDKINCVKAGLNVISSIEPTGIVGLINTFVYPSCRSQLLDEIKLVR